MPENTSFDNDNNLNNNQDSELDIKNKMIGGELGSILARQIPHQKKLRDMLMSWQDIVGAGLAKHSSPYDLSRGILFISADSSAARSKILLMRNNISRIIKRRWGLNVDNIRVTPGPIHENSINNINTNKNPVQREIVPTRDEINYFREQLPENLKPEAAEALARLRAVFAKKFK